MALYVALFAIMPSWQSAALAYAIVSFVSLVLVGGAVVSQVAKVGWRAASGAILGVSAIAMLSLVWLHAYVGAFFYILVPVAHSGSLTMSLVGLLATKRLLERWSFLLATALFILSAACMLSDKLFFGSFFAPLVGALVVVFMLQPGRGRRCLTVLAIAGLGCAVGDIASRVLFSNWLLREPDFPIASISLPLLREMSRDGYVQVELILAAIVAIVPLALRRRDSTDWFWWAVGASTMVGFFILLPFLYADQTATRYMQPVWWWAVVVLTSVAVRTSLRITLLGTGAVVTLWAVGLSLAGHDLADPGVILAARSPIAECLRPLREKDLIHAGIAQYWLARPIEVASDWTIQVEQVVDIGRVFVWGNNPTYYNVDLLEENKPTLFDFVVMKNLSPSDMLGRFGQPDEVINCPETEVWLYHTPGGIRTRIGSIGLANQREGILTDAACFASRDFITHSGLLPETGLAVPDGAFPHDITTWGPYVRLRAGTWLFRFVYRLDGSAPGIRDWDLAADQGQTVLQAGSLSPGGPERMTKDVLVTVTRDTSPIELRTMLQPTDHIQIESLSVARAGLSAPACQG